MAETLFTTLVLQFKGVLATARTIALYSEVSGDSGLDPKVRPKLSYIVHIYSPDAEQPSPMCQVDTEFTRDLNLGPT